MSVNPTLQRQTGQAQQNIHQNIRTGSVINRQLDNNGKFARICYALDSDLNPTF